MNGYALSAVSGVGITIEDTCFIDNNFIGDALIIAGTLDLFNQSNVYGTPDAGVNCSFALVNGTCIPFSSKTCSGSGAASASRRALMTLGFSFLVGAIMVVAF